ncbi:ABC transporter transmembrane domain-containing protein [Kitasatospora azatica]|uniref:ABC transporter transmembrane domain-containing protein n=1 Tax=Kitasatospora azatica TaxID=58347 RepID=UPI000B117DC3|nr:ABC transporter ATP-binding protein [Kitasatospora azatica]
MGGWGLGRAMRYAPAVDEPAPELGSPWRFLSWLVGRFRVSVVWGVLFGVLSLLANALVPGAIGQAVDHGIAGRDQGQLLFWGGAVLVLGLVVNTAAILRDRCSLMGQLGATYLAIELITRQSARLGATLPKRVSTGEVVSVGIGDIAALGRLLEVTSRASGAAVSSAVVALVMLSTAPELGLVVLAGVPLMAWAVALLIRPLHRRQERLRAQQGALSELAVDIAGGLRVLRGIGGEGLFLDRYRADSQRVRGAGVRLARIEAQLDGAKVLLPGVLVALVVWLGARDVLAGRLSMGQLVAFYGYAVFLAPQLRRLTEALDKLTRARVAAARLIRLLALEPELAEARSVGEQPVGGVLADPDSGLQVRPGRLTAVACARPADAAELADRLGRYTDSAASYGGVRLDALPLDEVRRRILVVPGDARLFSGPLRGELDPGGRGDAALTAALTAASALDVVEALPDRLDSELTQAGREFSGGQQQRLRLARALLADPEVLVLVEPTSAVDAHTEARIVERLRAARAGRSTLVFGTSPILLARADHVVLVADGKVAAEGTHRELLADPGYRAVVTREGDPA